MGFVILVILAASAGVVRLDAASPYLEAELTRALDTPVEVGGATIRWNPGLRRFALRIEDARIRDDDGAAAFEAPWIDVAFDWTSFGKGQTVVRGVALGGVRFVLTADAFGGLTVAPGVGPSEIDIGDALAALSARARAGGLEQIHVRDGRLEMRGADGEVRALARDVDAVVQTAGDAVLMSLDGRALESARGALAFELRFEPDGRVLNAYAAANDVSLRSLLVALGSEGAPAIDGAFDASIVFEGAGTEPATGVFELSGRQVGSPQKLLFSDVKGRGRLSLAGPSISLDRFTATPLDGGAPLTLAAELRQAEGLIMGSVAGDQIPVDAFLAGAPTIESFAVEAAWRPASGAVAVSDARIRVEDAAFDAVARVDLVEGATPALRLTASMEGGLSAAGLTGLWPAGVADRARDWLVENVITGRMTGAALAIDAAPGDLARGLVDSGAMDLTFAFDQAKVRFMRALPALDDVRGEGVVRGTSLEVWVPGARMTTSELRDLHVRAPRVDDATSRITITGAGLDSAANVMTILDSDELRLAQRFNIDASNLGGMADVRFAFDRPMLRGIPLDAMRITADAKLTEFSVPGVVGDAGLTNGDMVLVVDNDGVDVVGRAELLGLPTELSWAAVFDGRSPSHFTVHAMITPWELDRLGVASRAAFQGVADVRIDAYGDGVRVEDASVTADLRESGLRFPAIGWTKPLGEPAEARTRISFEDDGGLRFDRLAIRSESAQLEGDVVIGADGRLLRADFPVVRAGAGLDLQARAWRRDDDGLRLLIEGESLNAGPWLRAATDMVGDGAPIASRAPSPDEAEADIAPGASLQLTLRLREMALRRGERLENVTLDVEHDGRDLTRLSFLGAHPRAGDAIVGRLSTDGEDRRFLLRADDAGAFLRGMFGLQSVEGGSIDVDVRDVAPDFSAMEGLVRVQDFRLMGAPALARILSAGSLDSLLDLLRGEGGIEIQRLDAPFAYADGRIRLPRTKAEGPSVGATLRGAVDLGRGRIDLVGVVAPVYGLNKALGVIPVLGDLLTSRDGEGILGVVFAVQGPADEPQAQVSPLSLVAPGFLRRLFELPYADASRAARKAADDTL